jgi:predicted GNAT family N-acyltransferase
MILISIAKHAATVWLRCEPAKGMEVLGSVVIKPKKKRKKVSKCFMKAALNQMAMRTVE